MRKHSLLKILSIAFSLTFLIIALLPLILPKEVNTSVQIEIDPEQKEKIWNQINDQSDWSKWYNDFDRLNVVSFKESSNHTIILTCLKHDLNSTIETNLSDQFITLKENSQIPYFKRYFAYSKKSKQNHIESLKSLEKQI